MERGSLSEQIQGAVTLGQFQNPTEELRARAEGCPAASCCERLLPKSSATANLQVPNRKRRLASLSASTSDQDWPRAVRRPHTHGLSPITQPEMPEHTHAAATPRPAVYEEPSRLVQTLTGAILGCGGWVLSRGANDAGTVSMLFEFERQACVDIYSVMIAAGLELSQKRAYTLYRTLPVYPQPPA